MPFLNDFATAVANYPLDSVQLSIVDVDPPGASPAINVNEIVAFQVRVRNNGHLNMTNVALHIEGRNGIQVSLNGLAWSNEIFPPVLPSVNAHSSQDTVNFFLRSGAIKAAGTQLVAAHISAFDANLNDILNSHSGHANPPEGVFAAQVHPA